VNAYRRSVRLQALPLIIARDWIETIHNPVLWRWKLKNNGTTKEKSRRGDAEAFSI